MSLVTWVRAVGAVLAGMLGWTFGAASGVAAMGTAVSGAFVFGPIAALLGFLLAPTLMDKIAKNYKNRGDS